ncbi:orotidine-5'-phosphate decarboxylase [Sandaracinobacteroides saxicola]|uniref:Orotidine 5'-phosphate decarboxylase n=1 Tax=Sandaracinobacteroides saxicola TaxID=2759707 RepID=A0A7G5IH34_9SPHN|nr:orotidine-5'-phosphate decarboxylase [Sandaracinobacteroides saxicola]QMW22676.1 orotidine-5'-phosphate decarboxylase [Sandaracinobacteroides saxicola]
MNPIHVALDTPDVDRAEALGRMVRGHVGGLKLGLEFFMAHGAAGVRRIAALGLPIFLDVKLHDIPNTVAGALRALAPLELGLVNVHAGGGAAMLAAARAACPATTKLIAVTVLTSLDDDDLGAMGVGDGAAAQVTRLAALARAEGLDGVVCSPHEVAGLKAGWADGAFVVPGVRPAGADVGDQKRVMTPRAALEAGASVLVIGRPITGAVDPAAAAAAIAESLGLGL